MGGVLRPSCKPSIPDAKPCRRWLGLDALDEQLEFLHREVAPTQGGKEDTDCAFDGESYLAGSFSCSFVVDEHHISGLLLGEGDDSTSPMSTD